MLKIFSSSAFIILFEISLLFQSTGFITAQQSGWVEQDLPASMTGSYLANRGDDVLIFTKSHSDIVYFFDIKINSWTEANLGSQQNFQKVLGSGNNVFAYSDEYIIGYSSILSQWDTVKYQGNVIDPNGVSTYKGYGCANTLAYFATDANIFYVFDAELAQWQEYNYGIVSNASPFHTFWAANNYAGAVLGRNGYDFAKNIAYSLVTHSFAELDQGGWYYYQDNIMNGGYVSSWNDALNQIKYFGYSSYTNEFKSVTFPFGYDINNFEAWIDNTSYDRLEDIYVYTCGYVVGDQTNRDVTVKSYSTKSGNWYSLQYSYDPNEIIGGLGGWKKGGSFSVGSYVNNDANLSVGIWKFYGNTGIHIGENPDLFENPHFVFGGTVGVGYGVHNLWFHNFENGSSKHKYYPPDNNVYFTAALGAESYCTIFRVNTTSDTMQAFFFNGNTNNLQTFNLIRGANNPTGVASPRVYGTVINNSQHEVLFYSEEKDSLIIYQAPETVYGTLAVSNFLMGLTISTGHCVIFDANTLQTFEKNFSIVPQNIGDSLIFTKSGDTELTGYSGITKNWSTKQTDQQLNGYQAGDEIAIGYSYSNAKYWGYSAYNDSYYELIPEGGGIVSPSSMAGGKTAIVIRTDRIYAFSPGSPNSVEENYFTKVNAFSLSQNYPNPFNPSTVISYQLPVSGKVIMKVYDILGKEVATLVNEYKPAGTYEVEFNPVSSIKNPASGVYFYQLKSGDFIQTKKMILLR